MKKKLIPESSIEWLVARLHVSKTDDEVRAEIVRRTGPEWTPEAIKRACDYAVKCHKKNQDLYARVMSGRL